MVSQIGGREPSKSPTGTPPARSRSATPCLIWLQRFRIRRACSVQRQSRPRSALDRIGRRLGRQPRRRRPLSERHARPQGRQDHLQARRQGGSRRWLLVDQRLRRLGLFRAEPESAYSLNKITAKPGEDGSIAVQFGGCDGKIPNCLPTPPGWNYLVRLYRPRPENLERRVDISRAAGGAVRTLVAAGGRVPCARGRRVRKALRSVV